MPRMPRSALNSVRNAVGKYGNDAVVSPVCLISHIDAVEAECTQAKQRIAALEVALRKLQAHLVTYGDHLPNCTSYQCGPEGPCSCGFDKLTEDDVINNLPP